LTTAPSGRKPGHWLIPPRVLILLLVLAPLALGQVPQPAPAFDPAALDAYVQKSLAEWQVPGVALAIVQDDKVLLAKGYGVREAGKPEPVTDATLFGIASCSKAFTAAAIAILVDEGKVKWEDPVTKYLPGFQLYDPYVTRELTVRDLLCHRSGLTTFGGDLLWYNTTYDRAEVLRRLRFLKPTTSFRSAFGYQNNLLLAAGEIVPVVTGKSWDDFVKERIFTPLGMNAVTSARAIGPTTDAATPHTLRDGKAVTLPRYNTDNVGPAASVHAGAADMARWLRLQLNLGEFEGKKVYTQSATRAMWSPQTMFPLAGGLTGPAPTHLRAYALGWFVGDFHGKLRVEHDGSIDGMFSKVILIPEARLGVAAMTNSDTAVADALANRVIDALLGLPARDRSGEALASKRSADAAQKAAWERTVAARAKDSKPSLAPAQYAGKYGGDLYGDVTVTEEGSKLVLRFAPAPVFVADLEHWQHDTFRVKWRTLNPYIPDGWATFVLDRGGRPAELRVDCPNDDFDFTELELKRR
jgi:CubicO group peptidase (beta-lactamase class C family)